MMAKLLLNYRNISSNCSKVPKKKKKKQFLETV